MEHSILPSRFPQAHPAHDAAPRSLEDLLLFAVEGRLIDTYCFDGAYVVISIDGRSLRCLIPHVRSWLESALVAYQALMAKSLSNR